MDIVNAFKKGGYMDSKFLRVKFINWLFARSNDISEVIEELLW